MHCIDGISIELTIEMCIRSKSVGTRSDVGDLRNFKEAYCLPRLLAVNSHQLLSQMTDEGMEHDWNNSHPGYELSTGLRFIIINIILWKAFTL